MRAGMMLNGGYGERQGTHMTKRTKNIVFASLLLAVLGVLLVLANVVRAQTGRPALSYNETSYDVQVLDNGNTRVTMTLDYRLGKRESSKTWKQLYRTIPLSPGAVTNVSVDSVRNLSTGETYTQGDPVDASLSSDATWDAQHARQWYIATQGDMLRSYDPRTDGVRAGSSQSIQKNVEIGWNIPVTKSAKSVRIEVTMTLAGMVTACQGNDVFNWQPVDQTNDSPIRRFSATVRFPQAVDAENSTMWVHYDGKSTTAYRDGMFTFGIDNMRTKSYVQLTAMLPEGSVAQPARTDTASGSQLNEQERQRETKWRSEQQSSARGLLVVFVMLLLAAAVIAAIGMRFVFKQGERRRRLEAIMPYWRGLPPMSPGAAALVYDTVNGVSTDRRLIGRQLSATMLSLVTKGFARMYPGTVDMYGGIDLLRTDAATLARMVASRGGGRDAGTTSTIVLLPRAFDMAACRRQLCMSERATLDMLHAVGRQLNSVVFDTKQCAQCLKDAGTAQELSQSFHGRCVAEMGELGVFPKRAMGARVCGILSYACAFLAALIWLWRAGGVLLPIVIVVVAAPVAGVQLMGQTQYDVDERGMRLAAQVRGLGRYLEDFSHFADRGVLDVKLWGRYMVYATAFGIADKAMAQLTAAYPQLTDPAWASAGDDYSLVYWMDRSFRRGHAHGGGLRDGVPMVGDFVDIGARFAVGFGDVAQVLSAASGAFSGGSGGWNSRPGAGWGGGGR